MIARTTRKEYKQLRKKINNIYWNTDQRFCYTCNEKIKKNADTLDVFLVDKNKEQHFLFEIFNINVYSTYNFLPRELNVLKTIDFNKLSFETDEYTYRPYYFDRDFFIPKTFGLTKEDVYKACKYFNDIVLNTFLIFNYKFIEEPTNDGTI